MVSGFSSEAVGALGTRRLRLSVHAVRSHPPLIRFPGRLPHPRKGPIDRTVTDRTYDVSITPDGTIMWAVVGNVPEGGERSGRWNPRDLGEPPPDEGDALLIALAPPKTPVWEAFCREVSLDLAKPTLCGTYVQYGAIAGIKGRVDGTEGSHRVGRYADSAPVRTEWSARWTWSKKSDRIDLRSSVAHGTPQAAELKPRPFAPLYATQFEERIVVTPLPERR